MAHHLTMTDVRAFLIEVLNRVGNGGDISTAELDAVIDDPLILEDDEKKAWSELYHWADDEDVRAKSQRYAIYKRERIQECLITLERSGS